MSSRRITLLFFSLWILGLAAAVFTQFHALTEIPGFHFDEAWQGEFAHRISLNGKLPALEAMNSYTTPIVHTLLAACFKTFGSSLIVMRSFFAIMNLLALAFMLAFIRSWTRDEAAEYPGGTLITVTAFTWLWALLPLSVHDHRFYIEMTCFHGLCFAIYAWASRLEKPAHRIGLMTLAFTIACYSHILFLAVGAATLFFIAHRASDAWNERIVRRSIALNAALLIPLAVRMAIGTHKAMPAILALGLAVLAAFAAFLPEARWKILGRFTAATARLIPLLSLPYLFFFSFYLMAGSWPYAQVTSRFHFWIGIPNAILWITTLAFASLKPASQTESDSTSFFFPVFLISSALMLNQAPRYYMVPALIAMLIISRRAASSANRGHFRWVVAAAIGFIAWNGYLFRAHYVDSFQAQGATQTEFRSLRFHDSARDFRPIQKVFAWLQSHGCKYSSDIEPTTYQIFIPLYFMSLAAPDDRATCTLDRSKLMIATPLENFAPPLPGYRLLHTEPAWGDLAAWVKSP